jgi:hypothetical protein
MLVIYRAIDEQWLNRSAGEESYQIRFDEAVPKVGQQVAFGTIRSWMIAEVQFYQSEAGNIAYFALVYPENEVCPNRNNWFSVKFKQDYPALSFSVCLSPDSNVIEYGSNADGEAPVGYLSTYTLIPGTTRMQESQSAWQVWRTTSYHALNGESVYQAIQICDCVLPSAIAA